MMTLEEAFNHVTHVPDAESLPEVAYRQAEFLTDLRLPCVLNYVDWAARVIIHDCRERLMAENNGRTAKELEAEIATDAYLSGLTLGVAIGVHMERRMDGPGGPGDLGGLEGEI